MTVDDSTPQTPPAVRRRRRTATAVTGLALSGALLSGCTWNGLNSLPLPGAQGTGSSAYELTVQVPNAGTLTANSPVMIDEVTVGSIRKISVQPDWTAEIKIGLNEGTELPFGTAANVGQVSLLGSEYLELIPPEGEELAQARILEPGETIPLSDGGHYPNTEKTLSSLSVVLSGGGIAQLNDIITETSAAFEDGDNVADLLPELEQLMGTLDSQRGDIVTAMEGMNTLGRTVRDQTDVLEAAFTGLDPAMEVLADQREELLDAVLSLGSFSEVADRILTEAGGDLRTTIDSIGPILQAVADSGNALTESLTLLFTFPFPMETTLNAMRGDYTNLFDEVDLTYDRLAGSLFLGHEGANFDLNAQADNMMSGPEGAMGMYAGPTGQKGDPFAPPLRGDQPPADELYGPQSKGAGS